MKRFACMRQTEP